MPLLRIEVFGDLQITCGNTPITSVNTSRMQSLLAYLVLHCDTPVARERFAYLMWPESSESQARTNLRQLLHHLRHALPPDCCQLETGQQTMQWRRDPSCTVDAWEFDEAVERGALEDAATLYRDDLLSGLYDEWVTPLRAQYRERLADVLQRLALASEQRRDFATAIRHAERLVAHDPLREAHHQLLIRLHTAGRDRAGALRAYHQCMSVLRRELGVEPGPATRELFERVLKSEAPAAAPAEAPPTEAAAPLPIVGRDRELKQLAATWSTAERGGMQIAVILGEPGIGKSRLAEEVCGWAVRERRAVARTRCYAGQGHVAYAPIADWLRSEPLRSARGHMTPPQLRELARVLPEILEEYPKTPAPAPLADSRERLFFYESLNAAFGRARKPLLLAIDDLQWCDADSFEWLHSLMRSPAASQIMLLGTARGEEMGRDHPLTRLLGEIRRSGELTELALAPLNALETTALAEQISGSDLSETGRLEIYRSTGGNPLFVVESMRAGLGGATPARIHAVISARLAQLSKAAYELAGLASAIGRSFSFELLAKTTDWDEASLNQALDELWQRRIVEGHGAAEYDFTHDRLREVAYQELSLVQRRFLHRKLARIAEGPGAQAAHYEAAGMPEEAIGAYCEAASMARERYADAEASALLGRALALCREFPETTNRAAQELDLLVTRGPALVATVGYAMPEVGELYTRALELSRRGLGGRHIFAALSGSWVYHIVSGRVMESLQVAEEFLRLAAQTGDRALSMASHFVAGSSLFQLGRPEEACGHLEESLRAHSGPSKSVLALFAGRDVGVFARASLSHALWKVDRQDEADRVTQEALEAAERIGDPFSMGIALDYRAMLYVFRRDSARALRYSQEAAAFCRKHQFAYYVAMAEILVGWAMAMEGDAESGIAQLRKGIDALKATGAELRLPFYYGLLAEACAVAGRDGEALANLASALAFQSKNSEVWAAPNLERIQSMLRVR
jgi:DNA-binding SARP family transcriptional activator/predicted ATPase